MATAITLWNIVGITEYVFLVRVVPLHRNFNFDTILLHLDIDNFVMNWGLVFIQMHDKGTNTALVFKQILFIATFIKQVNTDTRVQER